MSQRKLFPWASRLLPLAILTGMLLVACGPSPSMTVQVGDATVQVLVGGSTQTEVVLTRSGGASADVTLDADGAPDWVTVTFAPATLTGSTLTSTMTVATDADHPDAGPTSFPLTVTAVAPGLTASDEVTVEISLLEVTGLVTDALGMPLAGVSVAVDGNTAIVSGGDGTFLGPEVTVPYDLVIYDSVDGWAHIYQGLTTTDLKLTTVDNFGSGSKTATVSGDLSAPVGPDQQGLVCIEGLDRALYGSCDTLAPATSAYSVSVSWLEGTTVPARVRAWVVDVDGAGTTTAFAAAGQTAVNLTDGVPTLADVALGAGVDSVTVEATITPPPGLPISGSAIVYHYGDYGAVPIPAPTTAEQFTVALPDVPGGTATLVALAAEGARQSYGWDVAEYGETGLDLQVPPALSYAAPADGATGVNTSTTFRVFNPTGGATTFIFSWGSNIIVSTNEAEVTIPDLSGMGFGLPAATNVSWQAIVTPHLTTVDELAAEGWLTDYVNLQMMLTGGAGMSHDSGVGALTGRSFTTE